MTNHPLITTVGHRDRLLNTILQYERNMVLVRFKLTQENKKNHMSAKTQACNKDHHDPEILLQQGYKSLVGQKKSHDK